MNFLIYIFLTLFTVVNCSVMTHDQTIISDEIASLQFFGNDIAADGDWMAVGTAINKVHFMKWNGTHYDDSARQVITGDSFWGTRVTMKNGWTFISGKNAVTDVYKLNAGGTAWEYDSTIPYGREYNRYPDTYNVQGRAVDITDDGKTIIIIDDVTDSYRIYTESGGVWTQSGNTISTPNNDPSTCCISGDGTRAIVCADGVCYMYDVASGTLVETLSKFYLGSPYSSYVTGVGVSIGINTDGSKIAITQNSASNLAGYVHFMEETSPNVWSVVYTMVDNDGWGGSNSDLLGSGIEYVPEVDVFLVNDVFHSDTGKYRRGGVYIVRSDPSGTWSNIEYNAWDVLPDGNLAGWHGTGWASGGMAYLNGKFITGSQNWDEPTLGDSVDGRVDILDISITAYPTPSPTLSPTSSPTPSPIVDIGTVDISMTFTNNTASQLATKQLIEDLKTQYSKTNYQISGTESISLPLSLTTEYGSTDQEIIDAIKSSRNLTDCTVVLSSSERRLLSRELDVAIIAEILYTLDEDAFNELQSSGNTLESESFLTSLAVDLGVPSENITVTVVGSEIIVEVTLFTESSEESPLDASTVQLLQQLQVTAGNATNTIISEIGDGTVTVEEVDICESRSCSGYGIYEEGVTTPDGCVISTGVCQCSDNKWGINCETDCTCENGGLCLNSYCQCQWPYHGVRCQGNKALNCTVCF